MESRPITISGLTVALAAEQFFSDNSRDRYVQANREYIANQYYVLQTHRDSYARRHDSGDHSKEEQFDSKHAVHITYSRIGWKWHESAK